MEDVVSTMTSEDVDERASAGISCRVVEEVCVFVRGIMIVGGVMSVGRVDDGEVVGAPVKDPGPFEASVGTETEGTPTSFREFSIISSVVR